MTAHRVAFLLSPLEAKRAARDHWAETYRIAAQATRIAQQAEDEIHAKLAHANNEYVIEVLKGQ